MLEEVATEGASMPIVVIEGLVQIRDSSEPVPMVCTPSSRPESRAQLLLGEVEVGGLARPQAGDRDLAVGVVQRGDGAHQRRDRVGHGAAEHAAVDAVVEGADGQHDADHPPQGRREGRLPHRPVGRVGQHDGVGAQLLAVPLEDRRQAVGADLLLALDEDRDADRQLAAVRAQGRDVGHDPGLVVGDATGVDPAVPLGRLERRGVPVGGVAGRLDVVVGVEQDRRRAGSGPSTCPITAGRPPSRTISTARPSARSSSATAEALASTWAWSNASSDTLGMRVSVSRSARMSGSRACTRSCRAAVGLGRGCRRSRPRAYPPPRASRRPLGAPSRYPRSVRHDIQCGSC